MLSDRPLIARCPLCGSDALEYEFENLGTQIDRCGGCSLLMRNPQPSDAELAAIYNDQYALGSYSADDGQLDETHRLKRETAARYLDGIEKRLDLAPENRRNLRLLEVGAGLGNLLVEASARGYEVTGLEVSESSVRAANERLGGQRVLQGSIDSFTFADSCFDVVVLADVIEHTRDPLSDVKQLWRALRPGGLLFIAVPSLDSWSARVMRERWMEFKLEHLFYFDSATIQTMLFKAGFEQAEISTGWKVVSPEYVIHHFRRFPVPLLSPAARLAGALMPKVVRQQRLKLAASGMNVLAVRSRLPPAPERPYRLSVIMPVFNERSTFPVIIEQLLAKTILNVDIEIVIVESNSTDGTRDEVRRVEDRPRVKVVYEEVPRGKGHAVRTGLAHATGDFILIQDADLEYDMNDYEILLDPLTAGRAAFVLGSRHGRGGRTWKVRHFEDQIVVSGVMNVGHWFFTQLFNLVYGTKLADPFTMYKVFRRDCLYKLTFESNRFDFDWELVGKLVRAGYCPLEIPVNYSSRSFSEGKKVSFFRDPLTYFRACFKYRFVKLGKKGR